MSMLPDTNRRAGEVARTRGLFFAVEAGRRSNRFNISLIYAKRRLQLMMDFRLQARGVVNFGMVNGGIFSFLPAAKTQIFRVFTPK